jgi:hypothetical protein
MKHILYASILVGLMTGSALRAGLAADAKPAAKTPWKISGDLEEACSCNPACPCWFKSLPTRMTCDGVQVVFIKQGKYGKTPLDGLAVGQFVQSPEGKSMFESFGSWKFDNVYIDEKATAAQRGALQEIAAHLFPPGAKAREFHYVPIARTIEAAEHRITVGNYGGLSGHLIDGGYAGSPAINNVPLADPTHRQFFQGMTTRLTYTDAGQGWNYQDSNYMFNHIRVDSRQYEKYEADLAAKMAQATPKAGM